MVKFLFVGDLHLRGTNPRNRIDDYKEAVSYTHLYVQDGPKIKIPKWLLIEFINEKVRKGEPL